MKKKKESLIVVFEDNEELKYLLKILFKVKLYQDELNKMQYKENELKRIPFYIDGHKTGGEDNLTFNNVIIEEEFEHLFMKIMQYKIDYNMNYRLSHPEIFKELEKERLKQVSKLENLK